MLVNLDRRSDDLHNVVKISPNAVEFRSGAGHRARTQGLFSKMYISQYGASKVPTTMPHVHHLNLVFEGKPSAQMLLEQLSKTRRVVVMPYEDAGKKHDRTSEILEAFVSGFERPISPEILSYYSPMP